MAGQQPPAPPGGAIESPIMGLFTDRPAHMIDPKGFSACNNVRIEAGRVRTDGIGWQATGVPTLGGGVFHMDAFSSLISGGTQNFVYAGTDMYLIFVPQSGGGTPAANYATPCYTFGTVSVTNGGTAVTGVNTRWNTNYSYGASVDAITATATAAAGTNKIYVSTNGLWSCGVLVQNCGFLGTNNPNFIPNGTFLTGTGTDGGGFFITISQNLPQAFPNGGALWIGTPSGLRNNVRGNDYIAFGTTQTNSPVSGVSALTWYQISTVNSDTSITLATPYTGSTLSGSTYVIRQCFSLSPNAAFFGNPSSDTYLAAAGWNGALTNVNGPAIATNGQCDAWFFSSGSDPVYGYYVTYTSSPSPVYVPTIPYMVRSVKQFRGIMVYGGLSGFINGASNNAFTQPTQIASSDDGFPVQLNTGVAFQGIATSGPFPISRMGILGANLMLYGTGTTGGAGARNPDTFSGVVTSASFVGFPTIWSFSDVIQTRGPVNGGAVAVFSDRHQFLAVDGEYRYNGLFIQVMNDHVWREVIKNFDWTRNQACFCFPVSKFGDLIWAVPLNTDSDASQQAVIGGPAQFAWVEHYMEQANSYLFKPFTQRDFPFVCGMTYRVGANSGGTNNDVFLTGDQNGNIWQLYAGNSQGGVAPLCTVTWATRNLADGRNRPLVTRIYPELEYQASPVGTVNVTLTMQDAAGGPVVSTTTQPFSLNYPNPDILFTAPYRRGRYGSVTLSDQASVGWIADGYYWDVVQGGRR